MNSLPFSLNIFRQIEVYQNIKRLDNQFDKMLVDWRDNEEYKKNGISEKRNLNYPTWEIEKKILFWVSKHHKHLGAPITSEYLKKEDLLEDMHISKTEIGFAGSEIVLENLVVRGLADWDEKKSGALIIQQGLEYGLIINNLNRIEKDTDIKEGQTEYRDYTLKNRRTVLVGYELLYWAGLLVVFLASLFLGLSVYRNLNINVNFNFNWLSYVKYFLAVISFLPVIMFVSGVFLILIKKIIIKL